MPCLRLLPSETAVPVGPVRLLRVPRWRSPLRSFALARNPLPVPSQVLARPGDTVELFIGGVGKRIFIRDPGLIQHVLPKNHRNYAKSKYTRRFSRYIGHGLRINKGPDWLRQRLRALWRQPAPGHRHAVRPDGNAPRDAAPEA